MPIQSIVKYPDARLRQPTRHVAIPADEAVRTLVADMIETMYVADGAGLAAIQIGSDQRIFVVDGRVATGNEQAEPLIFCNPELTFLSPEQETAEEGCLSFPGIFVPIKRSLKARCRAVGIDGVAFEVEAEGLYARALQHEMDHLDGRLLIDRLGPVKREMVKRKMRRAQEEEAEAAASEAHE